MGWSILSIVIIFFAPLGIIFLTKKIKILSFVGPVALCYLLGMILAVSGIPYDKTIATTISELAIPIAIVIILFSLKLKTAKGITKKTLLAFGLVCASATIVCTGAFFIANPYIDNAAALSAMASGLYTGGTPNLNAIGMAMGLDSSILALANTSDLIVGGLYFLFLLTFAKPVYSFILKRRKKQPVVAETAVKSDPQLSSDESAYANEYGLVKLKGKKEILKIIGVILLGIGCLGVSAGVALLLTGELDVTIVMLGVTTLGIGFSFVKPVRETKGTFQVGHYLILIFSLSLSMCLDLKVLVGAVLPIMLFLASVQTATIVVHLILCKVCKIDADTAIITSTAGVYGPAFIPPIAEVLKNNSVIIPGLICGILGYAVGNFLGIGLGNIFLLFV